MTADFPLNWANLAVSIFNTVLLLWLGLTVLLNSERRSAGVWVAGLGLLMSSLFFLSHSAILGLGPLQPEARLNLWWKTGWIPVVSMPFAWYLVMLWYSSYWDNPDSPVHQRHQVPLVLASLLAISTIGLVFLFNALPSYEQLIRLDLGGVLSIGGIPVLMIVYPFYLAICIGFSLDVLLHPGMPSRLMGQHARRRARPWLLFATLSLLLVSLLVGAIIIWGIYYANRGIDASQFALTISLFDLVIDLLIAITILSVGQAVVSYEIFTGKILPRQGLKRYWELSIILSLVLGATISWGLLKQIKPVYLLLLSLIILTVSYAIMGWRSFTEQERYLKILNPFISSQHLYDQLLFQDTSWFRLEIDRSFFALCKDILGVRQAFLIPLGIYGPLVGSVISYPKQKDSDENDLLLREIRHIITTNSGFTPILLPFSAVFGEYSIALSLWSERGLIGALVLGEKNNGSLFTQEEIDVARTIGERLIDSAASNELSLRLMELQRQHLSETQIIDQQTRRKLHDDILPRMQSTMITFSSNPANPDGVLEQLGEIHRQLTAMMRELPAIQEPELARLGLLEALQVSIDNDYHSYFNSLTWQVDENAIEYIKPIPAYASTVIYHATREAVRNAARHGRAAGSAQPINLHITINCHDGLVITVRDDGVGFDPSKVNEHNNVHGLALHSTLMAVVGGSLAMDSVPGNYTKVVIKYLA